MGISGRIEVAASFGASSSITPSSPRHFSITEIVVWSKKSFADCTTRTSIVMCSGSVLIGSRSQAATSIQAVRPRLNIPNRDHHLLMPPYVHSISAGRPAVPDSAPVLVFLGLLESAKGTAGGCLCLGDFVPHDSGPRSGVALGAERRVKTKPTSRIDFGFGVDVDLQHEGPDDFSFCCQFALANSGPTAFASVARRKCSR
jgi:hypothetical protein